MQRSENINIDSYLTFKLGDEQYAAHVSKVLNILEMVGITKFAGIFDNVADAIEDLEG